MQTGKTILSTQPVLGSLKQEDCAFEASQGYIKKKEYCFIAALFTMAKRWPHPKCSIDG
jgi:hypothetical protein